jgi:hypothetical protein
VHAGLSQRVAIGLAALGLWVAVLVLGPQAALAAPACGPVRATAATVGEPTAHLAWRAGLVERTPLWRTAPPSTQRSRSAVAPDDAPWLLVLGAAPDLRGRCWLEVRLPARPNDAAGWLRADRVDLRPTPWRIAVTRRSRSLSVYRNGHRLRRFRVVVGQRATPTPRGLFSIVGVWPWNPDDFLGAYILPLTAHSNVLQEFGNGDGRLGIHGRGGASLFDPLGAARSHGCVRLPNTAIDWIVHTIGADHLPVSPCGCGAAGHRNRSARSGYPRTRGCRTHNRGRRSAVQCAVRAMSQ